jgi:transcriptional regulator with XRE-family HTH domain
MNTVELGLQVARARRQAGLSQKELAARARTTQAVISRIESGDAKPGWDLLERIAGAVGRPLRVTYGSVDRPLSRADRRSRVEQAIGDFEFNPWDRDPSPAEERSLIADGLDRERFARS